MLIISGEKPNDSVKFWLSFDNNSAFFIGMRVPGAQSDCQCFGIDSWLCRKLPPLLIHKRKKRFVMFLCCYRLLSVAVRRRGTLRAGEVHPKSKAKYLRGEGLSRNECKLYEFDKNTNFGQGRSLPPPPTSYTPVLVI